MWYSGEPIDTNGADNMPLFVFPDKTRHDVLCLRFYRLPIIHLSTQLFLIIFIVLKADEDDEISVLKDVYVEEIQYESLENFNVSPQ